jgi:hypothetical protein
MESWAVPLGTLIIAMATLAYTARNDKRKAELTYVERLERRLAKTEEEVRECIEDRDELRRRLYALECRI